VTATATAQADPALVDAVLHPVRGHMAFESCVEQLGSAIQLGVFEAGSKLPPERELAEKMDVSRATLREAISALRAAGLVTTTRGRGGGTVVGSLEGARLPNPDRDGRERKRQLDDVLIFRRVVEPGACFHAASVRLEADARALLADCLTAALGASAPAEYRQADARLHLAIASASGSAQLAQACSIVQTDIHGFLGEIPFLAKNIENSDEQHERVVRAILDGDPATARSVMEAHCDATAALLKGLLT
jgi:GntR family transcriptional repressor for pyruvate dehydrogenase complex